MDCGHFTRQEEKAAAGKAEKGRGAKSREQAVWGGVGSVPAFCLPMTGLASASEEPATPAAAAAQGRAESCPNTVL